MESLEDTLRELRAEFVRESAAKLEAMHRSLDSLERRPAERATLFEMMRAFHGYAGSGASYGFPAVSEIGREGEQQCSALLTTKTAPSPAQLVDWRSLMARLAAEFEQAQAAAPEREPRPVAPAPAVRPPEILIIDDDEELLGVLTRLIEQEGMIARAVPTRQAALQALAERLPEGLIVDIRLPDGSGYEVVEQVRAMPGGDSPAVLILSMLTGFLDKVEATHCGADGYFEKPMDWEALMRRLIHLLERSKAIASRVLSVEDDKHQAAFLRAVLESAGYEVHVCEDPRRFDAELIAFRPELVIMDIVLPGVSGHDLVRYLRQDERYATLPVIFLTTQGQMEAQIASARAGGDSHLVKPVPPSLLLTTVADRIERARFLKSLLGRDGLTRLLTRGAFLERAQVAVSKKRRTPSRHWAWVMIDLDHFKDINDRHGHPAGDRVLAALAALLRRRLRQSDTIGRYGGEEFAILLEDLMSQEAARLVDRIRQDFAALHHSAENEVTFQATFSAGVALLDGAMDVDGWCQAADAALYAAKNAGRDRTVPAPEPPAPGRQGG